MSSFDEGLVIGLAIGKKKFSDGGEIIEKETDWTYPADWPPLPDPGDNEIYILVTHAVTYTCSLSFGIWSYEGTTIDWGDGQTDSAAYPSTSAQWTVTHEYEAGTSDNFVDGAEAHIIKIHTGHDAEEKSNEDNSHDYFNRFAAVGDTSYLKYASRNCAVAMAIGNDVGLITINGPDGGIQSLQYLKFCTPMTASNRWGNDGGASFFQNLYSLKRLDFGVAPEVLPSYFLGRNTFIRKIDLPSVTEIGAYAFLMNYALESVNCPNCAKIGYDAFYQCLSLHNVTFSDDCTYGDNAGYQCYQLYPPLYIEKTEEN